MNANHIIVIISACIMQIVEGYLLWRDRKNADGSTVVDQQTRTVNILSVSFAVVSPLLTLLVPQLQFSASEISAITCSGAILIGCGLFLRYWSIYTLGSFFRTIIEVDQNQHVVQVGPYQYVRHPSYSGYILFFIGYGLASQNWLSFLIAAIVPAAALLHRIQLEEPTMLKELGSTYREYQKHTWELIPWIW